VKNNLKKPEQSGGRRGWALSLLLVCLAVAPAQAFIDSFEAYTNGATFVVATNGWQASTNLVQVQTNVVEAGEGSNAVILPQVSTFTNSASSDISDLRSVVWTDYRICPALGQPPAAGDMTNSSDSVRLYFDSTGYVGVESNRNTWVICSKNAAGNTAATQISNQWVRISVCVDYARSNAAVFADGELLRAYLPLPGTVATNYNRVLWDVLSSTSYLDSVSITNVWPAFATNSVTDLDNDGMLDAQELQVYGNLTNYHRPTIHLVATNLTLGAPGGGTTVPAADFTVMPNTSTNFTFNADPGYHVYDVLTNGVPVGTALSGRNAGQGSYNYAAITTDTTVTVEFRTNYLVTTSAGTGGNITPSAPIVAYPGTNLVFAITSSAAFVVATITSNGVPVTGGAFGQQFASYTLNNIQTNISLAVTFSYTSNRTVGASGDYPTLNAAVMAALAGDTIHVSNGTYTLTTPVVITNQIALIGNTNSPASVRVVAPVNGTDLDCFQVGTNGVRIEGFLMTGATNGVVGVGTGYLNAGIMVGNDAASNQMAAVRVLTNLGNGTFLFNQFSNCTHGVYVMAATNCLVSQSEFLDNTMTGVWASVSTDARSNWWGTATGPGPVGPGTGSPISLYVVTMPWWESAARAARVIYTNAPGLQAALDLAAADDVIWTTNGTYAGDIVIDRAVRFLTGFSLDGKITFSHSFTLAAAFSSTNATVANNVTVSIATGGSLTAANLVIQGSGLVVGGGGTAQLSADGYSLSGVFTANSTWATLVPSTLEFSDNFESYTRGMLLQAAGLRGWSATADNVLVQTNYAASTNALILPPKTEANNTVSTVQKRIWTDFRWLPILGDLSTDAATCNQSIRVSFDTNGWLAVDTTNGWVVCSNNVKGGEAPKASNEWVRVTVFQDYQAREQAVFLNNVLLRQQLAFVGTNAVAYDQLRHLNTGGDGNLYMDSVSIGTNLPAAMTGDLNGNDFSDALEIHLYGNLNTVHRGSVFKIR
jgi:hypothetical protein